MNGMHTQYKLFLLNVRCNSYMCEALSNFQSRTCNCLFCSGHRQSNTYIYIYMMAFRSTRLFTMRIIQRRREWERKVSQVLKEADTERTNTKAEIFKKVYIDKNFTPVGHVFPLTDTSRWDAISKKKQEALRNRQVEVQPEDSHEARVTFIGPPSGGKSELVNTCVTSHISARSSRPHTTTSWVKGITHVHSTQLILMDTPGVFTPRNRRERSWVVC